ASGSLGGGAAGSVGAGGGGAGGSVTAGGGSSCVPVVWRIVTSGAAASCSGGSATGVPGSASTTGARVESTNATIITIAQTGPPYHRLFPRIVHAPLKCNGFA